MSTKINKLVLNWGSYTKNKKSHKFLAASVHRQKLNCQQKKVFFSEIKFFLKIKRLNNHLKIKELNIT